MKKIIFSVFVVLFFTVYASAQVDSVSSISFPAVMLPGTSASTSIINTGNSPAKFLPLYPVHGMEYAFQNDSSYIAWLRSMATASDPDERRFQMVIAEGTMVQKTLLFLNNQIIFGSNNTDLPTNVFRKQSSMIGAKLAQAQKQCGNYVFDAIHDIVSAGDSAVNFRTVTLRGHVVGEFEYHNRWVKMDMDPGEPGFIETNNNSSNLYASVDDIINDTSLFQQRYKYVLASGDSMDIAPISSSQYREYYTMATAVNFTMPEMVRQVSGEWTLCGGCQLDRGSNVTTSNYYLDTFNIAVRPWYDSIKKWVPLFLSTSDSAYIDSTVALTAANFNLSPAEAKSQLFSGGFVVGGKYNDLISNFYNDTVMPTMVLTIPPHSDTIILGRDLQLPFLVKSVSCKNCLIGDSLVRGAATWNLWASNTVTSVPYIPAAAINYLDSGYLMPQASNTVIELYYNANIYDFSNGFRIDNLENHNALAYRNNLRQVATGIATANVDSRQAVQVYPSPMMSGTRAIVTCGATYRIFDTEGRELFLATERIGDGKYSVTFPDRGYYLIYSAGMKTSGVLVL